MGDGVVVAGVGEAHGDLPALVVLEVVVGDLQVPVELVVVVLLGGDNPVQVRQDGILSFINLTRSISYEMSRLETNKSH